MADLQPIVADNHAAVTAFVAAAGAVRPVIRTFFLKPVLKAGRFGKGGKAPVPFQPTTGPSTARSRSAASAFEADVQALVARGQATVDHPFFGTLPLPEYLRLQAIHTRHHHRQLPGAAL
jgi:hypothetical protein